MNDEGKLGGRVHDTGSGSYRVADGTQVNYAGRLYAAGEVIHHADPRAAVQWLARRYVTAVPARKKRNG